MIRARFAMSEYDNEAANDAAFILGEFGFNVKSSAPGGVIFEGTAELFESVFGSLPVQKGEDHSFPTDPVMPEELEKYKHSSIYFPTKPTFFD